MTLIPRGGSASGMQVGVLGGDGCTRWGAALSLCPSIPIAHGPGPSRRLELSREEPAARV